MATKKSNTTANAEKKTAGKKTAGKPVSDTKVICPVCGSEFAIGEHEHTVKNATVIGADSGLGTIVLPVSKRGEMLQAAGIDTSKYFSIELPGGGSQMMRMDDDGHAIPVTADDPIISQIINGGTVPNRNLFRRWIMSQVFHGLQFDGYNGKGFAAWLKGHYYNYQWKMLIEELRVQSKLYGKDNENFTARNRWYNQQLAVTMADDYLRQLRDDALQRPTHKCKGIPYVTVDHTHYFVSDIDKKLINPLNNLVRDIRRAKTPQELYVAVRVFWDSTPCGSNAYKQCSEWVDAYKGAGAYFTMQNLLRFHGASFPHVNTFFKYGRRPLDMLEDAAVAYSCGEGWRLFGLMKQMLEENHIDIEAKQKAWARAKELRKKA